MGKKQRAVPPMALAISCDRPAIDPQATKTTGRVTGGAAAGSGGLLGGLVSC
jgi:hypothetical protein